MLYVLGILVIWFGIWFVAFRCGDEARKDLPPEKDLAAKAIVTIGMVAGGAYLNKLTMEETLGKTLHRGDSNHG